MSKLIVWNIMSLDGYFEGTEPWDLALHEHIWGEDLHRLSMQLGEEMGLLVFGRRTYEGMATHWPANTDQPDIAAYMNAVPKLVASRTMTEASWQNTTVTADIVGELTRRKTGGESPTYVFGSAELTHSLLEAGLVDELLVGISPVLLGAGTPLFGPSGGCSLTQLEAWPTDTGGVVLRYAVTSAHAG